MHVERTADQAVLRWVCHLRRPVGSSPDLGSPRGELLSSGELADVRWDGGDLLVTVGAEAWSPQLLRMTDDAVRQELELHDEAVDRVDLRSRAPTLAAVQAAIDRAVGAVASEHGGRIEVVELAGDVVVVDLHDACAGCPGAERTLLDVAERAVATEFGELSRVRARAGATHPRAAAPAGAPCACS